METAAVNRETIAVVEQVARDVRMRWGALKNLVCGFTTVAHHGEGYRGAAPLAVQTTAGTALTGTVAASWSTPSMR